MKMFIVQSRCGQYGFTADCIVEKDGILEVVKNHFTLAQFKEWDCWYEEEEEENHATV